MDPFDVVRDYYRAMNRADAEAVLALYHDACITEQIHPGGTVEVGDTLEAAVAREVREETGLLVDVGPVVKVFDRILLDDERRARYHYVLVDYLCRAVGGRLAHGSDVTDVTLADPSDLAPYAITAKAAEVVRKAATFERGEA